MAAIAVQAASAKVLMFVGKVLLGDTDIVGVVTSGLRQGGDGEQPRAGVAGQSNPR
jgi:hypothetical protein